MNGIGRLEMHVVSVWAQKGTFLPVVTWHHMFVLIYSTKNLANCDMNSSGDEPSLLFVSDLKYTPRH